MYVCEYMVGGTIQTLMLIHFLKMFPLMGGLTENNECLVLLHFTFIVFLT